MKIHVAILTAPYDRLILEGEKTIESRFYMTRKAPWQQAQQGDLLYLKRSGGPYFARARVKCVEYVENCSPEAMDELRLKYNHGICGTEDYWALKREKTRYVSLLWLDEVEPCKEGPEYQRKYMNAWYVLGDPEEGA